MKTRISIARYSFHVYAGIRVNGNERYSFRADTPGEALAWVDGVIAVLGSDGVKFEPHTKQWIKDNATPGWQEKYFYLSNVEEAYAKGVDLDKLIDLTSPT